MRRGEVWWAEFDEPRPVLLLGGGEAGGFEAVQIVAPSGVDLTGMGLEVSIGAVDGFGGEGVVRLAFPHPDFLFCTWLTRLGAESLVSRAGVLPPGKLEEVDEAIRQCAGPREPDPEATARLAAIRDGLRGGASGGSPHGG